MRQALDAYINDSLTVGKFAFTVVSVWRKNGSVFSPLLPLRVVIALISLAVLASAQPSDGQTVPQLNIEAPQNLAGARARLESFDAARLWGVVELVGLDEAGPAIRVVLASESSEWARQVPPSTAGFAVSGASLVILFPSRSPAYPHDTLEDVLHHEIAHVLTTRAAGGRPLPLWFNEGLAMAAERAWGFEDQARLLRELALVSRTDLDEVDALFAQDEGARQRAYILSGAFVRDLIVQHGSSAPARVLDRVARGESFDEAFAQVTGETVAEAESAFWNRHRFWTTVGPFLTTSTALWMFVTLIALYAIVRRRQKSAALHKRWEQERVD